MFRSRRRAFYSVMLAALVAAVVWLTADTSLRVRAYFRIETFWSEHWPVESQRGALESLEPALRKLHILRPARVQVEPGVSFFLEPGDLIPDAILRSGQWQPEIWSSVVTSLSEGAVFFDVGAHIGYFSMKAARAVGKTGRVVSFEPNPDTLKLLRDNVVANHAANVIVEPIACTDQDQMLTFYAVASKNTGASSLAKENAEPWAEVPKAYQVRGRPIDDVVRELNLTRVDAMKVDVEGAELSVLRGAIGTLRRFHPKVVIEVSAPQLASFHTTPDDLVSLLKSAGYDHGKPLNPEQLDWEWTSMASSVLASKISVDNPRESQQFLRGVHPGNGSARWTDANFAAVFPRPPGADKNGAWLSLKLYVAGPSIQAFKSITLSVQVNGAPLASQTFTRDGVYEYRREVPASALGKSIAEADFSVDKFLTVGADQDGVMIMTASLESK